MKIKNKTNELDRNVTMEALPAFGIEKTLRVLNE